MRVAVIEDQALVRDYLSALVRKHLGADEVVAIGSMAELQAREAELDQVSLILFDIDLGDGSTLDWALARVEAGKRGALVALSSVGGTFPFKRLQAPGVISLVHKSDGEAELLRVIQQALGGQAVLSHSVREMNATAVRDSRLPMKLLSETELQVLAMLGQRLSNEEIAALTGTAVLTAADHRKRIMRKLGLHSIEEVIDYAIRHGVIHDSRAAAAYGRRKP